MTDDIFDAEHWLTEKTAAFVAGLRSPGGDIAEKVGTVQWEEKDNGDVVRKNPDPNYNQRKTELLRNDLINFLGRENDHLDIDNETGEVEIDGIPIEEYNQMLREEGLGDFTVLGSAGLWPSDQKWRDKKLSRDTEVDILNEGEMKIVNPPLVHDLAHSKPGWNEAMQGYIPVSISHNVLKYCKQGTEGARIAQEDFGFDQDELPETTEDALEMFEDDFGRLRQVSERAREGEYDVLFYKPINGSGGDHTGLWSVEKFKDEIIEAFSADIYREGDDTEQGKGLIGVTVPHVSDIRTVVSNSGIEGGEFAEPNVWLVYERVGPHDCIQTNLDELDDELNKNPEKLVEEGHLGTIDHFENSYGLKGVYNMSKGGLQAVQDYLEDQEVENEALGHNVGVMLGLDFGVINHQHPLFRELPEPVQDYYTSSENAISNDRTIGDKVGYQSKYMEDEDIAYLINFEGNVSPGMKGDRATDNPRSDTRYNLRHFLDCMSWGKEFEPGEFMDER